MPKIKPCIDAEKGPEPLEVMEQSIIAISHGFRKLQKTRLNNKALLLLIQHSAPTIGGKRLSTKEIQAVLDGIDDLEKNYLKKA